MVACNKLKLIVFIGATEREILNNIEDIVKQAPLDKLKKANTDLNTSKKSHLKQSKILSIQCRCKHAG